MVSFNETLQDKRHGDNANLALLPIFFSSKLLTENSRSEIWVNSLSCEVMVDLKPWYLSVRRSTHWLVSAELPVNKVENGGGNRAPPRDARYVVNH